MIMRSVVAGPLVVLVAWFACAPRAEAHRLDEYLQATRVSIELDRVTVEIDLTAGTSLAASVFGWIDTDGDGQLSGAERAAYARQVIDSVMLTADGRRVTLAVTGNDFPDRREMTEGIGAVRLRANARIPSAASGRHVLTYLNSHRSESSVYLANALVPTDNRIAITSQRRDPAQHMLTLEYDVAYGAWPQVLLLASAIGILSLRRHTRLAV